MESVKNGITSAINKLSNFREYAGIAMISIITIIAVVLCGVYYLYMKTLQSRNCSFMDDIYGALNTSIISIRSTDPRYQFNFNDYYIKSAYNCCSAGNYKNNFVSLCALKDVIKQGVRGLDFQIFSINDQPVVATSTVDNYNIKETYNYINFGEVLAVIRDYALAGTSNCPNPTDPVIIHLRIQSANQTMYQNFANLFESFNSLLLGKEYSYENHQENLGNRKLLDFHGKIVIIVDRTNLAFMECADFYEYVNMTSNSMFMRALHYYDIAYTPDLNELIEFNKRGMTIGMPDKGSDPPNPSSIVMRSAGVQMLAMRYQLFDSNLEENELFFDECGHAFCLKPLNLRYVPVVYEAPAIPSQDVSYATRTVSSDFYSFDI